MTEAQKGAQPVTSTSADSRIARREPWYGERELRYLKDFLEGLLGFSTARAPTRREVGFRAWLREGLDNWIREDLTGALTLERPVVRCSNGKQRRNPAEYQLRLGGNGK